MAEIQDSIRKPIGQYLELLQTKGFPVKEAYLYGSYANGLPDEWSDIDVAVVSDKFEGNRFLDSEKILGLYSKIDLRLSILPLSPDSLDSYFIQKEVIGKGIKII
jgi:predicted nucleotidyltransferase